MRYSEKVMTTIRDAYTPRVEVEPAVEEVTEDGKVTQEAVPAVTRPDPDVLYVGPFIDGIVQFVPEILIAAFPNNPNPVAARRHFKTLLLDTRPGDRGKHFLAQDWSFSMKRLSWPLVRGEVPKISIEAGTETRRGVLTAEPGELMNSPTEYVDAETGEIRLVEYKGSNIKHDPFVPKIREDKKWGLHYLMRGDLFVCHFRTRRGQDVEMQYELRPASEGSSLLTPERQLDVQSW